MLRDLYTALGTRIHLGKEELGPELYRRRAGRRRPGPGAGRTRPTPTEYDEALRASHDAGMKPVGTDVGHPGDPRAGPGRRDVAFFGPVVTPAPKGEAAGRLWDGVLLVAGTPGFFELKRTRDAGPDLRLTAPAGPCPAEATARARLGWTPAAADLAAR